MYCDFHMSMFAVAVWATTCDACISCQNVWFEMDLAVLPLI